MNVTPPFCCLPCPTRVPTLHTWNFSLFSPHGRLTPLLPFLPARLRRGLRPGARLSAAGGAGGGAAGDAPAAHRGEWRWAACGCGQGVWVWAQHAGPGPGPSTPEPAPACCVVDGNLRLEQQELGWREPLFYFLPPLPLPPAPPPASLAWFG